MKCNAPVEGHYSARAKRKCLVCTPKPVKKLPDSSFAIQEKETIQVTDYVFEETEYVNLSNEFLNSLTSQQQESIHDYTISDYQEINTALWEGNPEGTIKQQVNDIDSSINNYQDHVPEVLWRNLSSDLSLQFLTHDYQPGDIINFPGFTSTSETPEPVMGNILSDTDHCYRYNDELLLKDGHRMSAPAGYHADNVVFKINGSHAAPVSMSRGRPTEQEWLIGSDTSYSIVSREESRLADEYAVKHAVVFTLDAV